MKIAVIEFGSSHEECLYSQIKFLKSNSDVHVTLICSEILASRISYFDEVDNKLIISNQSDFKELLHLKKYIKTNKIEKVIFNSAQGNLLRKLMLIPFWGRVEFLGVHHNIKKIKSSFSQKLISLRIKKYYVLNDYIIENIDNELHSKYKIGVFYPIFFQTFHQKPIEKKAGDIWICVPGSIDFKRRDYSSLIEEMSKIKLNKNIKILLLGRCNEKSKDGQDLIKRIKEYNLEDNIMLWHDFVDVDTFFSYIQQSDFIMSLIHSIHSSINLYKLKISGTFNLAFGMKKPMLTDKWLMQYDDFKSNSVSYEVPNMIHTLNNLKTNNIESIYKSKKWDFTYQANKYWELINK